MLSITLAIAAGFLAPDHPSKLTFPEYVFTPPLSKEYREELSCGVPVYIVEDNELPLVNLSITFRGGGYLETRSTTGLVSMMGALVRSGGTTSISAEELDEKFAYLAASVSVSGGGTTLTASLNSLSSTFDETMELFLDMLQRPGFQDSRLRIEVDDKIESMKQRNDHPSSILRRESSMLLYGDSYLGREPVEDSINSITKPDLVAIYTKIVNPSNMIVSISGDFNKANMLQKLDAAFCTWIAGDRLADPPDVRSDYAPGIYFVDRDVPQGGVRIMLRSIQQNDPDLAAATIMNYILGGGGFSSRITKSVRSDEGLAYGVGSRLSPGIWGDGVWGAGFESKNSTVALATKLVFDEIEKIKAELVSEGDLALAKSSLVEQFPSVFGSKSGMLSVFVNDELSHQDPLYWQTYRDKINAVSAEDIKRVANRLLRPEDMLVVVVGNWAEIEGGDKAGRAQMSDILAVVGGQFVELPLRNPLTLEGAVE